MESSNVIQPVLRLSSVVKSVSELSKIFEKLKLKMVELEEQVVNKDERIDNLEQLIKSQIMSEKKYSKLLPDKISNNDNEIDSKNNESSSIDESLINNESNDDNNNGVDCTIN